MSKNLSSAAVMIGALRVKPGWVGQSVTYLTAHLGVTSWIPARSHTFLKIDREIISMVILLPSADSRRLLYVHKVLVNCLVKLAQEKSVVR